MSSSDMEKLIGRVGDSKYFAGDSIAFQMDQQGDVPHAEAVFEGLRAYAEQRGWTVRVSVLDDQTEGVTKQLFHTIDINEGSAFKKAVVLAHELAHTTHGPIPAYWEPLTEMFAESVSFLVANALGWPTSSMEAYLTQAAGLTHLDLLRAGLHKVSPMALMVAKQLIKGAALEPFLAAA